MVWMQQNKATLEAAFAQTAPAWSVLASYLGERGVTDGDGKLPTARTTRDTWARVKADAGTKVKAPAIPVVQAALVMPASLPAPLQDEPVPASSPHPRFGMATLRKVP